MGETAPGSWLAIGRAGRIDGQHAVLIAEGAFVIDLVGVQGETAARSEQEDES